MSRLSARLWEERMGMLPVYEIDLEHGWVKASSPEGPLLRKWEKGRVMLGSGLRDKKGREIYEGDFVERKGKRWKVLRKKGCFLARRKGRSLPLYEMKPKKCLVKGHRFQKSE